MGLYLTGKDGELEMTEDGMMPVKVSTRGAVRVDSAADEGSHPLAKAKGRAHRARRHQLTKVRIAATSARSSVILSTSSYHSAGNQEVIDQITEYAD